MTLFPRLALIVFLVSTPIAVSAQVSLPDPDEVRSLETIEGEFDAALTAYLSKLESYLPDAYRKRFMALSDEQMAEVARVRRLWQHYTLSRTVTHDFQKRMLDPLQGVADILLIDPERFEDPIVKSMRATLLMLARQLMDMQREQGVNIDPTVDQKSPTGIAYPPLDQPHTAVDEVLLMERTMILAMTVASPEARRVLLINAERCLEIDIEEAAFVMQANEVRMLTGTIAWVADPLTTACARDHSIDRKEGRASGHSSTVPGKEGFGARLRRFGAKGRSEGAGGGRSGVGALRGLSYGGGHTGPLYSLLRNAVGPGRHAGVFTAVYYTDQSMKHDCHATNGELFLPPGVTKADMTNRALRAAYTGFFKEQFSDAYTALTKEEPAEGFEGAIHRYLAARLNAEVQWTLEGIARIANAGDIYEAHRRLEQALKSMSGIPAFDNAVQPLISRFEGEKAANEIEAGALFRKICRLEYTKENLNRMIEMFPDSIYVDVAKRCIAEGMPTGYGPLLFFYHCDKNINEWGYLQNVVGPG